MRGFLKRLRPLLLSAAITAASALPAFAEEEDVGFPQLKQSDTYVSQIFWLALSFVLLYLLMSRLALPQVGGIIDARRKTRQGDLDEADKVSREAEQIRKTYEDSLARAQGVAQDLGRNAEQELAERVAAEISRFGEAARARLAEAEQAISRARQEAAASLVDIAGEIASEMAAKVANVQVSKADAKIVAAGLTKE
jgi:F-type H+-transporting ATPase subunit b